LHSGVCYERSSISFKHIKDGQSQTYLIGEKYIDPREIETGRDPSDNEHMYAGYDNDIFRSTHPGAAPYDASRNDAYTPRQDTPGFRNPRIFGSAHSTGINMVFCDGSARTISYTINKVAHGQLGNRHDERLKRGVPYVGPPDLSEVFN
jgi:prepilin-type processing-associated H-X9-DG protein